MTGQSLTLRGEFKADESVEREQYLYRERRFGSLQPQPPAPGPCRG
jgi:HSP20 family molecular chaperone IbpA